MGSKEASLFVMAITITRNSARFVAKMDAIPPDAIIRVSGQHWDESSRI